MNGNPQRKSTSANFESRGRRTRRGSVMGLMAILFPVLAILAAFCINAAQMQLNRTELIVATDAAARAGGRAFSELQSVHSAKSAAIVTAALNTVNGDPLLLRWGDSAGEISFGLTTQPDGLHGRYEFEKVPTDQVRQGNRVASAVRVHGNCNAWSLNGRIPFVIPGLLEQSDFETFHSAVAMQVDRDISLVLDRSGSMDDVDFNWPSNKSPWYTSTKNAGVEAGLLIFEYSSGRGRGSYYYAPGEDSLSYQQWVWQEHYQIGPAPTPPWQDLVSAVNGFLDLLEGTSQQEQVSIASYSTYASLETWLEKDFEIVRSTVGNLTTGGWTAIGRGMEEGIKSLVDSSARPYAAKTMVVMTDGIHNRGISPSAVAQNLMGSYKLTIHTVTFGDGADQAAMQEVAGIGGGKHYHAATGSELIAVFEEIANNLPTILTK
ncbi:MAG: vWA domain-containing protein [Rubripirellula sp.]